MFIEEHIESMRVVTYGAIEVTSENDCMMFESQPRQKLVKISDVHRIDSIEGWFLGRGECQHLWISDFRDRFDIRKVCCQN